MTLTRLSDRVPSEAQWLTCAFPAHRSISNAKSAPWRNEAFDGLTTALPCAHVRQSPSLTSTTTLVPTAVRRTALGAAALRTGAGRAASDVLIGATTTCAGAPTSAGPTQRQLLCMHVYVGVDGRPCVWLLSPGACAVYQRFADIFITSSTIGFNNACRGHCTRTTRA